MVVLSLCVRQPVQTNSSVHVYLKRIERVFLNKKLFLYTLNQKALTKGKTEYWIISHLYRWSLVPIERASVRASSRLDCNCLAIHTTRLQSSQYKGTNFTAHARPADIILQPTSKDGESKITDQYVRTHRLTKCSHRFS